MRQTNRLLSVQIGGSAQACSDLAMIDNGDDYLQDESEVVGLDDALIELSLQEFRREAKDPSGS